MNSCRSLRLVAVALLILVFNAAGSHIKRDEVVVFFPGFAWHDTNGLWMIEAQGWVFEPERRPGVAVLFHRYLGLNDDNLSAAEKHAFSTRTKLFLVDAERGKNVNVQVGAKIYPASRTTSSGQFALRMFLNPRDLQQCRQADGTINLIAALPRKDPRQFSGVVHVISDTGISVVSDVDDTIKISEVQDRHKLLHNTFVHEFKPVPGMAEMYRLWGAQGAAFHYVSASPCQLYPVLSDFVKENGFPPGSMHFSVLDWKSQVFHKASSIAPTYKPSVIEPLIRKFPNRRFILVGDSGESDPEIYGAIARNFPKQVACICIRELVVSSEDRYQKAFAGVPRENWIVFRNPAELKQLKLPFGGDPN